VCYRRVDTKRAPQAELDRYKFSSNEIYNHNNRCFSTKNNTVQTSAKIQQMSQNTSLVVWGQNLPATIKERFSRAELAMVKLPINVRGVIVGLILSDGWLRFAYKRSTNALLGFKQSLIHSEYICRGALVFNLLSRAQPTRSPSYGRPRSLL